MQDWKEKEQNGNKEKNEENVKKKEIFLDFMQFNKPYFF